MVLADDAAISLHPPHATQVPRGAATDDGCWSAYPVGLTRSARGRLSAAERGFICWYDHIVS